MLLYFRNPFFGSRLSHNGEGQDFHPVLLLRIKNSRKYFFNTSVFLTAIIYHLLGALIYRLVLRFIRVNFTELTCSKLRHYVWFGITKYQTNVTSFTESSSESRVASNSSFDFSCTYSEF